MKKKKKKKMMTWPGFDPVFLENLDFFEFGGIFGGNRC